MDRISALPDQLLLAIVARIQANVSDLNNDGLCYIALDPDKTPGAATGGFFAVVAPLSGEFESGYIEGGGQNQLTVNAGFLVRIYSTAQVDPARQDGQFLTSTDRGIFPIATKVLKALALFDPVIGGEFVVRDQIEPSGYSIGRNSRNLGFLELTFKLNFDWNLA